VVKSGASEFLIEVKCPYKWRNATVLEACKYCYVDENNEIKLKTNNRYYTQIQEQLAVCNFEKCELVLYTKKDLQIIEIYFDKPFWESLLSKLQNFYITSVVPAILK